jgi:hypothetical protein
LVYVPLGEDMSRLIWDSDIGEGHVAFDQEFFNMDRTSQLDALIDWKYYLEQIYECMSLIVVSNLDHTEGEEE